MRHPIRTHVIAAAVFMLACSLAANAHAQAITDDEAALTLDFRLGSIWPLDAFESNPSVGGRVGLYLWSGERANRLSIQITGDYRSLGYRQAFYEGIFEPLRTRRSAIAMGAALGFDVMRTDRITVDVRGGAMMIRDRMSLEINTRPASSLSDAVWEPICHFQGFDNDCQTTYDVSPTIAFGLRRSFGSYGDTFAGIDYTHVIRGRHALVGTFGVRLR